MASILTKSFGGVQKASSGLIKGATDTLKNANIQVIIGVVLVLYIAFIETSHDSVLRYFLTNPIGKIIVLCIAVLLAIVSPGLAILFTIFILISMPGYSPFERFQDGEMSEEEQKKKEEEEKTKAAAEIAATEAAAAATQDATSSSADAEGFSSCSAPQMALKGFKTSEGFSSCSAQNRSLGLEGFYSASEEGEEGPAEPFYQRAEGLAFAENNDPKKEVEGFTTKQLFSAYQ
jgi:hypothetical protein